MKRFRANQITKLISRKPPVCRTFWVPQIHVDGRWCCLSDNSYPTGIVEAKSEWEARKKAEAALREVIAADSGDE
ncbi:hypothetical protein FLT15_31750 [Paenibacillus thiaminolyticus]|uniref:hypothetical protein n=1 Tax=Paenibacillus thiaminolyticus TaxID=49283 RepID=UPI001162B820|nr:hypothetical protein [Paenibacillus thiaminolyticus]NGP62687.1 hypothetical protein [Paenibacillus thiaminolyticus]NGP62742.1 hypothetical protein [Paenibacillus thiaminolyticus]